MQHIFEAARVLATSADIDILFPVHPNPNVRAAAHAALSGNANVHLVEPLDYFDLVQVLQRASLVLTDSGGIQEEAPTFGVPVLVLREVTERPEGLRTGAVRLVGTDTATIVNAAREVLAGGVAGGPSVLNPYGDGHAGERIADIVCHRLCGTERRTSDWDAVPTVDFQRMEALRQVVTGARP